MYFTKDSRSACLTSFKITTGWGDGFSCTKYFMKHIWCRHSEKSRIPKMTFKIVVGLLQDLLILGWQSFKELKTQPLSITLVLGTLHTVVSLWLCSVKRSKRLESEVHYQILWRKFKCHLSGNLQKDFPPKELPRRAGALGCRGTDLISGGNWNGTVAHNTSSLGIPHNASLYCSVAAVQPVLQPVQKTPHTELLAIHRSVECVLKVCCTDGSTIHKNPPEHCSALGTRI